MFTRDNIVSIISLIPIGKVISYKTLADIFCSSSQRISKMLGYHPLVVTSHDNVDEDILRHPKLTNYYISLITKDDEAIEYFEGLGKYFTHANPGKIVKTPVNYHITLADLSSKKITPELIEKIFAQTEGLEGFNFTCGEPKAFIDHKKKKVLYRIKLENNPFLFTLHHVITKIVPRRSDKHFTPHITIAKLLENTSYKPVLEKHMRTIQCSFQHICITANIDNTKDMVLFEKRF